MASRRPSPLALTVLTQKLVALRVACGSPSYAQLYKISAILPPSTTSGVLNSRTAPKLAFVLAYVRAVLAYADANDVPVPGPERELDLWKLRWERLYAPEAGDGEIREDGDGPLPQHDVQPRAAVPWQLPAASRLLIGRDEELAWLDRRLEEAGANTGPATLLLHGPAGAGKSALALTWARRRRDQFPDGQLYADFGARNGLRDLTPPEVLIDFLAALGHSPGDLPADESGLAAMFRSALADRTLLVVIENAERPADVRPFLPGDGRSIVLVTARERLHDLIIQDGIAAQPVPALAPEAAVELLSRSAPGISESQARLIAEACGYLPLPLRVAADTVQRGEDNGALQDLVASVAEDRRSGSSPSIGTILTWSLGAASSAETGAFAALSLVPGAVFDVYEAAAVLGLSAARTPPLLTSLTRTNLITAIGAARYELHPLIRDWVTRAAAADALSAEYREEIRMRLLGYYLWTADAADRVILPQRGREPLTTSLPKPVSAPRLATPAAGIAWVGSSLTNLTAAVVQAEVADDGFAYLLPYVLTSYFNLRKPWPQWQQMCQAGIRVARRQRRPADVGHLSVSLGIALREMHRAAEAAAALRRAHEAYGHAGLRAGQAMALNNLATVYSQLHQPREAADALREALTLLDQAADPFRTAIVLHNLAEAELKAGELDGALEHVTRARDIALAIGDRDGAAMSMSTLAEVHDRLSQWPLAAAEYRNAIDILAAESDSFGQINARRQLGRLLIRHGQPQEGAAHLDEAASIEQALGPPQAP